jgi:hypothetical protein
VTPNNAFERTGILTRFSGHQHLTMTSTLEGRYVKSRCSWQLTS